MVGNSGLSEAEIQTMISDAQSHSADDKKKKELAELRNNADGLIYTTEKSLEEYASLLSEKDREEIKSDLGRLRSILNTSTRPSPADTPPGLRCPVGGKTPGPAIARRLRS